MAYSAEEEQELENLKSWWKENQLVIILSIVVACAAVFGWRYWETHQTGKIQEISAQYDQLIYGNQDLGAKSAEIAEFVKTHDKTTYAALALVDQAKFAVEKHDFATAEAALKQALEETSDDILSSLIAIRLAAVQYQLQQYDAALASLQKVKNSAWDSRKYLMNGDILLAKGDTVAAKDSYELARANASPLELQWLQVRLNNL